MSSKQKKQSPRNKYKTSKKTNTKSRNSVTKESKKRSYNKRRTSKSSSKSTSNDYNSPGLSLSPFYSFSNHWSYLTRQYLCLSTWGTCMGGINEQYDDLLDQEASIPLAEESYKRALNKWHQEKDSIDKYNRENINKYERIRDEQLEKAYNITNKNTYNEYNVFNYPLAKNTYRPQHNIFQKPQQQHTPPPIIQPIPKQIPILKQEHKVPEYSYFPTNNNQNIENIMNTNTENIYNVFNTYNTLNSNKNNNNNNQYETYEDDENNMYNKPSAVKYDKAANINNNTYAGGGDQETMQSQNNYPNNESKQDLEDKLYKSGSDGSGSGSGSVGDNEESKSNDNDIDNSISPQLIKKKNTDLNENYLASPDQSYLKDDPKHMKAKSFGRKFSMFEEAVDLKKRRTIEQKQWKKQHHSGTDSDADKQFKPYDGDGVQYIQEYTYHPAAHHVQPHMPRKMSTKEYSAHMKEKEDPDAIITDNDVAALPASDKIKLFSMMSTDKSLEKQ